ncbi:acetyltransferase GNAT family protein [Variibacter gotjawalensis]|uniref:Acetyltransferase GNAT family protein n=1 Tax=Variibacter gotjawalensis TaxID=1333996 RepID=A0A0S3PTX0_9BRAD|nr:GNAT family N-acetyltransferase [Variibacter gotjawalensis]NIK49674.1 ribosomal protein S18 acetylase RimI-like enzyme [Variibacter gotjawalensis]RZS45686.1 acetyltransferase (GNAT) family protein [Variibacter gotjawalensis]BAT59357.1 acetyltransferase GNAT family protein [Variibacter gotjawalensis]
MSSDKSDHDPLAAGYHALAPGDVANVVTYLEMTERPKPRPMPIADAGFQLVPLRGNALADYRKLFSAVGEDWLWTSRVVMPDDALRADLDRADFESYALLTRGIAIGLIDLDFGAGDECELKSFGLVAAAIGQGAGRYLMTQAIARAFAKPIKRFWLHTCTFDSPQALGFYKRSGFRPFKFAVEVMRDPRLDATLPRTSAPHIPLID